MVPCSAWEPRDGSCPMTRSTLTVSDGVGTSSTRNPAAASALRAARRPAPTTSGTAARARPSEMFSVIVEPYSVLLPPVGSWPMTVLRGLSELSRT